MVARHEAASLTPGLREGEQVYVLPSQKSQHLVIRHVLRSLRLHPGNSRSKLSYSPPRSHGQPWRRGSVCEGSLTSRKTIWRNPSHSWPLGARWGWRSTSDHQERCQWFRSIYSVQWGVMSFSPTMPPTIRNTQNRRTNEAGSPKSHIPTNTVPTVPIPVQT